MKKFLQKLHSPSNNKAVSRLLLAPDVFAECEDIVLQVPDDPFEVKLRTNYEVHVASREYNNLFLFMIACLFVFSRQLIANE